jgi:excinuclease ABC subunit A
MTSFLEITGAGEHNLKSVSLSLPKGKLIVFTGVSGSGKSSLAFDTIYVEGQRKYIESLSSYARQFLGQLERPRYEKMKGLAPTVAIEQKSASANPRSTVGTVTEILDYLRVMYARVGDQRCPGCGSAVGRQDPQQVVDSLASLPEGSDVILLAPQVRQRKGEFRQLFEEMMKQGFVRFRVDGKIVRPEQIPALDKKRKHDIDIVVDRFRVEAGRKGRLAESVELALKAGKGRCLALVGEQEHAFSEHLFCDRCSISLPELSPQLFSFNNPLGACPGCHGLGVAVTPDPAQIFTDRAQNLFRALRRVTFVWVGRRRGWEWEFWDRLQACTGLSPEAPVGSLTEEQRRTILFGDGRSEEEAGHFGGLWGYVQRDLATTGSDVVRRHYSRFLAEKPCLGCRGARLRPEALSVLLAGASIHELTAQTVSEVRNGLEHLAFGDHRDMVAAEPKKEALARLRFLEDVGLEYLTLDRAAHSLSGGEAQRIRLARQLGSELSGVIYILDEPSVGLHQRDSLRLIRTLERLRDLGNTVLVVEHDRETIEHAEHVVDFGPGAGRLGGEVVYAGDLAGLKACAASQTGAYLSGREEIPLPAARRVPQRWIEIDGIRHHNLRGLDVRIPLGVFCVVTGVSGAGKSSLVSETLHPLLEGAVNRTNVPFHGQVESVRGLDQVDRAIIIDQGPIGRTPRSNPATYTKVFDVIRRMYAATKEARVFGYGASRFSFNVKGGRCEKCGGDGLLKIEMHFLPDVYITCPQCQGKRFNEATLRVAYKGKDISQLLDTTVDEALEIFAAVPAAARILRTMADVGLGYIRLGQPSPTLSGGEAQRIKLSRELARREHGHTFYILDEPTTGLHFHDFRKLLAVAARLVDSGHTVLMVEHNLDVVKGADWVIDMGPEGGTGGGRVVVAGPPEQVAACPESYTGRYLAEMLVKRGAASYEPRV